jgi:hypothetical protein
MFIQYFPILLEKNAWCGVHFDWKYNWLQLQLLKASQKKHRTKLASKKFDTYPLLSLPTWMNVILTGPTI